MVLNNYLYYLFLSFLPYFYAISAHLNKAMNFKESIINKVLSQVRKNKRKKSEFLLDKKKKVGIGVNVCQKGSKILKKSQNDKPKNACAEQKEILCTQRTKKMSGEFLGTFENAIHKSRIMIPANFKKKFAPEANETVIVTVGPDGTVAVFPLDTWLLMRNQLETSTEPDDKELLANMVDFAMPEQKLEGPGRIRISDELLRNAEIKDIAKIKGEGHFITLWNPERLVAIREQKMAQHKEKYNSSKYQLKRKS